jgi:thioredoxin 1
VITEATREDFRDLVAEGVTLLDVWGPLCRPCIALRPHVEKIADQRDDLRVVALEAPKARRLCMELSVMGLPTFLLLKDGQEVARLSGQDVTEAKLDEWLEKSLAEIGNVAERG